MIRVAVLVAVLMLLVLLIWIGQRRLIYFPFGELPEPGALGLSQAESITLSTEDGLTLGAWFVPAAAPRRAITVIVFNGNAGNRAFRAPLAAGLAQRGMSTLLLDYRGYGGNPGTPTEEGLAADARAARRYVSSRAGRDRIVYFGESLGGGVAVRLAVEQPPDALVLRSPFTSLTDIGRHHYPFLPVGLLLADRFASIDRIRDVRRPLLVIAADRDSIIPTDQSRRLFEAAPEPKQLLIVERTDHNDYELLAGRRVLDAIAAFLDSAFHNGPTVCG
jgi:uncharacterized protein